MGNNGQAKIEKVSHSETYKDINYATSSMQGWRPTMEDGHLALCPYSTGDVCLFAVFDGHLCTFSVIFSW